MASSVDMSFSYMALSSSTSLCLAAACWAAVVGRGLAPLAAVAAASLAARLAAWLACNGRVSACGCVCVWVGGWR